MARKSCLASELRPHFRSASRSGHRNDVSPWVRTALQRLRHVSKGLALDIPSGRGRHSRYLIDLGFRVVAADLDHRALLEAASQSPSADRLLLVRLNALRPLPFPHETFDLVVVIHPHSLDVLAAAKASLRGGGHLILETFGAHGENWRDLPRPHQTADELLAGFEVLACKESRVAKAPDCVTVKGIFRKPESFGT
jgi:SAM-dependent methyltransferase